MSEDRQQLSGKNTGSNMEISHQSKVFSSAFIPINRNYTGQALANSYWKVLWPGISSDYFQNIIIRENLYLQGEEFKVG